MTCLFLAVFLGILMISPGSAINLENSLIPQDEIYLGGPLKDGIPALTNPHFFPAKKATYMRDEDLVVGVEFNGDARAYPLRILVWHENANDVVGGKPIAVSYCPLCNSVLVFDRDIGGQVREFGISGRLWNSNVLLYDRQKKDHNESLWSQVLMKAVTGPAVREELELTLLPSRLMSWSEWVEKHPQGKVLSFKTGYRRDYDKMPYGDYFSNDRLVYPVKERKEKPAGFRIKDMMVVVRVDEYLKAYRVKDVAASVNSEGWMGDSLGKTRIKLTYSKESESVQVEYYDKSKGRPPVAYLYWFAVSAMMPDAEVFLPR